jgi:hypothetical protein
LPVRKVPRSIHEGARNAARLIAKSWQGRTSRRLRKKVEMLFAHLKRILKLDRLRLRGPKGARDEFLLAATAQNLGKTGEIDPNAERTASPRCEARTSCNARRNRATSVDRSRTYSTESANCGLVPCKISSRSTNPFGGRGECQPTSDGCDFYRLSAELSPQ